MGDRTPSVAPITSDPWAAFGYLVSGVALYGGIGWGLSLWLGIRLLIPVGILVGAVLGLYLVVSRFKVGMAAHDAHAPVRRERTTPTDRVAAGNDLAAGRTTSRGDDDV